MTAATAGLARPSLELKSASLPVVAVMLTSPEPELLLADLGQRLQDTPGFFDNDAVLIDLTALQDADAPLDFPALCAALRAHSTLPVAVRGGTAAQMAAAAAAGLAAAPDAAYARATAAAAPAPDAPPDAPHVLAEQTYPDPAAQSSLALQAGQAAPESAPEPAQTRPTVVVDKPLRSGQQVYARGADLVVLAVVSFGAEVIADGNVHVYAPLRGRAVAGARGNTAARIFTTCLEPQLVSIAGIYRTTETELADNVRGKPAQIRLDGEKLIIEPLS